MIKQEYQSNENMNIFDILLDQQKNQSFSSQFYSQKSFQQRQRMESQTQEQNKQLKFHFTTSKQELIKQMQINLMYIQMSQLLPSLSNLNHQNNQFLSDSNQQALLVMIKNTSFKYNLQKLQNEMKFQNSLLQSFSHELRTPLNCSIQMLSLALAQIDEINPIYPNISQALASNQLLGYQLNDILDYSAMECKSFYYQWNKTTLSEILNELNFIYKEACNQKSIQLVIIDQFQLCQQSIYTDKRRISQIFVNLINNSLKFTQEGGLIKIKLKKVQDDYVKLSVIDNGLGIPEKKLKNIQKSIQGQCEDLSSLYKKKDQNNYAGLGISISNRIAKGLIEQNENHLRISSKNQNGTKVSFFIQDRQVSQQQLYQTGTLQKVQMDSNDLTFKGLGKKIESISIQAHSVESDSEVQEFENLSIKKKIPKPQKLFFDKKTVKCNKCINVLVVDDIPFNQLALKTMLTHYKIQIDQAYDGYQAIQHVEQKLRNEHCKSYQLIFMDIEMPGIDGFKATQKIRELTQDLINQPQVVICSAYDTYEHFEMGQKLENYEILPKPVVKRKLEEILKKYNLL